MPSASAASFSSIEIPFLLNFSALEVDKAVIFAVAVLMAITVNAEAQAFMATALGDGNSHAKDRFHFNPLLHIHLAGLLCFAAVGFGWPKQIHIATERLKHPAIALPLIKFSGAFANLILAGIAGSILWVMSQWNLEDQVFTIVAAVNIMVFVCHFIPIPPLAGATLFYGMVPEKIKKSPISRYVMRFFPYLLLSLLILIRIKARPVFESYLYPIVQTIFKFISSS